MSKTDFYRHLSMLFAFAPIMAFAQYKVSGTLTDQQKVPVEFASVLLQTPDSIFVRSGFTDEKGFFELNEKEGKYILSISFLGSVLYRKEISLLQHIELGAIQVEVAQILDEVVVSGEKKLIERRADRIIFNVDQSVYSSGSDALQILDKAPRVQVQNNDINIVGRGSATVLLNDRVIRMSGEELGQFLRSIPSDDIQKIEVIPNPPEKYDAEGAALINIILKKSKTQGYSGSVFGRITKAKYAGGAGGATFNYNKKKISLSSSLSNLLEKGYREEIHEMRYTDEIWKDTVSNPHKTNILTGRLGLNIDLNEKSLIGMDYTGNYRKVFWNKEFITTRVTDNKAELLRNIINHADIRRKGYSHTFSTYYTNRIDTSGKKISIGFDYFNGMNVSDRNFTNETYNHVNELVSQPIPQENTYGIQKSDVYTANFDMEHPTKIGNWTYGVKFSNFQINSNNEQSILQHITQQYQLDSGRSDEFTYKEFTEALYAGYRQTIKSMEVQAGLRIEYTQLKGVLTNNSTTNKQRYIRPFPSLMVQYTKDENHQFNFSINSMIDRPAFWQLNPFRSYYSQYFYSTGNPFLQPSISYNFSLEYVLKENFTFSLYYNYSNNDRTQINFTDDISKENIVKWVGDRKIHDWGIYNDFNFSIKDKWEITLYYNAYVDKIKTPYLNNAQTRIYWGLDAGLYNDFILDKKQRFTGNVNFYLLTPGRGDGERIYKGYYDLSGGVKAQLLKDRKLTLALSATNILRSRRNNAYSINPMGHYFSFYNYYNNQSFTFSINYKFGNNKLKNMNRENNNDDINRAK